ncbi:LPXTG cell wall anchor domain-containing protein [Leifsonia aquatica]|uniref:LPXTG cell wall anchor domain-containing protein n=1 Tax=Leifsonia aquatica TaxID=144185 RepID=UPI0038506246
MAGRGADRPDGSGAHTITASIGGTVAASAPFTIVAAATDVSVVVTAGGAGTSALASTGSDLSGTAIIAALALLLAGAGMLLRRRTRAQAVGD